MKYDSGKPRLTLVPPFFIEGMARVLEMGEERYGRGNWKEGLAYSRILDAARRHLAAIEQGEDIDPDSGMQHAFHVACNMAFLSYFICNGRGDLDDRHHSKSETKVQDMRGGAFDGRVCPEPGGQMRLDLQDLQQPQPQRKASETDPVAHLQDRIAAWADQVYPHRTTEVAFAKMMGEIGEVLLNPEDPLEWADVVILLVDAAKLRGVDILQAAHEKMAINEKRQWEINPETGLMSHVEGK